MKITSRWHPASPNVVDLFTFQSQLWSSKICNTFKATVLKFPAIQRRNAQRGITLRRLGAGVGGEVPFQAVLQIGGRFGAAGGRIAHADTDTLGSRRGWGGRKLGAGSRGLPRGARRGVAPPVGAPGSLGRALTPGSRGVPAAARA